MWKALHVSLDPTNTHGSWGGTWYLTQLTMVLKMVLMVLKMLQVEMVPGSSHQRAAVHGWMPSTTACDSIQSTPSLLDRPVSQSTMRECFGTYCSFGHPVCPILQYCLLFSSLFKTFMTTRESLLFDELQGFYMLIDELPRKSYEALPSTKKTEHTLIRPNQILRWNVPHTSPVH